MSTLRIRNVFTDSKLTLIAVESVDFQSTRTKTGGYSYGRIEPIAVVARGPDGLAAFDMKGKPVSVAHLIEDAPGLDDFAASDRLRTPPSRD